MSAVAPANLNGAAHNNGKPELQYWHLWTDERGTSHQTRCSLTEFELQSMGGAAPQWNDQLDQRPTNVLFSVLPVGWIGDWHENPKPQWIVPLSGRWFVESMDGTRMELGVGDLSFGGDQGCTSDAQGHRGHRSGTVGDQPAVLLIVQLDQVPDCHAPCCFS
ncbi:MAG: cupin domain-containing protein [Gammaproteobacteria bacterium]